MFVTFKIVDFDLFPDLRVPTIEIYRYSDNSLVASLARGETYEDGFYSEFFTDYDRTTMYFKLIAPSVRLNMISFLGRPFKIFDYLIWSIKLK